MELVWPIQHVRGTSPVLDVLEPAQRALVEKMAVEYLWNWSGRSYGLTDVTVHPRWPQRSGATARFLSGLVDGTAAFTAALPHLDSIYLTASCGCRGACSCRRTVVKLPWPTHAVKAVRIDGATLDPTAYRLERRHLLIRHDGLAWPECSDVDAAPGSPGTWEVDLTFGLEVPVGGQIAAGLLAEEFAKATAGDNTCKLPQRVQSITRQGVTMMMLDPFKDLDDGHTGIWLVDSWVASVTRPRAGGRVYSVDVPRGR